MLTDFDLRMNHSIDVFYDLVNCVLFQYHCQVYFLRTFLIIGNFFHKSS